MRNEKNNLNRTLLHCLTLASAHLLVCCTTPAAADAARYSAGLSADIKRYAGAFHRNEPAPPAEGPEDIPAEGPRAPGGDDAPPGEADFSRFTIAQYLKQRHRLILALKARIDELSGGKPGAARPILTSEKQVPPLNTSKEMLITIGEKQAALIDALRARIAELER